jgi:endonuclease/exonuclease/phosphatase family metal-dependent hydrolase
MKFRILVLALAALTGAACRDAPTVGSRPSSTATDAARTVTEMPPPQAQRRLGIMTYNLYLGANLLPLMDPSLTPAQVIQQAAIIWDHVQTMDFRKRAGAIARLIGEKQPHLVGLEEVSLWETAPYSTTPVFTTQYDYLQLLLDSLQAQGTPYKAVVVNNNFTATLPVTLNLSTLGRYTQRNAIIARTDLGNGELFLTNPQDMLFQTYIPLTVGGQPLNIKRGWASVDVQFRGKWFRFVVTHPEAFNIPVRMAQAAELVTVLSGSPYDVIVAGDLNAYRTWAGDCWDILTSAGFTDVWSETMPGVAGYTASFGDELDWPVDSLNHTVDYVLRSSTGTLEGVVGAAEVVGDEAADKAPNGWWPSDHAGVFVTVRIVKE